MKISVEITIGILVIIMSVLLYAKNEKIKKNFKTSTENNVRKSKLDYNPYLRLRNQAINVTPDQLKLKLETENEVYGMIMDWNMGEVIASVVSFRTGDASVYLSTGQAFIGGYAHETIITASNKFIAEGEKYYNKAIKTVRTEPANENKVVFYFLTKSDKYYIEDDFSNIENGTSNLVNLFEAGNLVITEYRMLTDNK